MEGGIERGKEGGRQRDGGREGGREGEREGRTLRAMTRMPNAFASFPQACPISP